MLPQRHLHLHAPFRLSFDALVTLTFDSDLLLVLFSCNTEACKVFNSSFLVLVLLLFSSNKEAWQVSHFILIVIAVALLFSCKCFKKFVGFFGMKINFFNMPSPLTNGHKPRCSQLGIATPTRINQISSSSRTGFVEGFFREVCRFWFKVLP